MIAVGNEVLLHVADDQLEVVLVHVEYLEMIVALATAVRTGVDKLGQLHAPLEYRLSFASDHVSIIPVDHDEVYVGIHDDRNTCVYVCLSPGVGWWHHVGGGALGAGAL